MEDDEPGSSGARMTDKKRYGDPRKNEARESAKRTRRKRSKRELSVGFIFFAWIVFFALWFAAGSLLVAAIVFGVLLSGGVAALNAG